MRLLDLDPKWVNYAEGGGIWERGDVHSHVAYHPDSEGDVDAPASTTDFASADGVMFLCPACFVKNGGAVGTEEVCIWFAGRSNVPADAVPGPGRWTASGTSFDDLTLTPSVNVDHEHWHGFLRAGEVTHA